MRHAFPKGTSHVLESLASKDTAAIGAALYTSLSDGTKPGPPATDIDSAFLDPSEADVAGQSVLGRAELPDVEVTKQLEVVVDDLDASRLLRVLLRPLRRRRRLLRRRRRHRLGGHQRPQQLVQSGSRGSSSWLGLRRWWGL